MANTLAYYDTATITAINSFLVQAPGFNPNTFLNQPKQILQKLT